MNEQQNVELKLIHMEDVVSKEVEWLWYPYIPYGKNDSEFSSKASCVRSTSGVHAF